MKDKLRKLLQLSVQCRVHHITTALYNIMPIMHHSIQVGELSSVYHSSLVRINNIMYAFLTCLV